MSDVESLENLSNAELRSKCIEFGLPNVPVTDSSRKVLLKKLRLTMTTKEDAPKSGDRRETIHVSKTTPVEGVGEPLQVQETKNRRTIATAPVKDETSSVGPTSTRITTRRRSVQPEKELKTVKAVQKDMPTIVLEDDEDINLVNAVENAEKDSVVSVPIETISSRRRSRSVSVPEGTEVVDVPKKRALTPLVEEKTGNRKNVKGKQKDVPAVAAPNDNTSSQMSYQPTMSSHPTSSTQPTPKSRVDKSSNSDQQKTIPFTQPMSRLVNDNADRYNMQSSVSTVYSSVRGVGSSFSPYRPSFATADILNEQSDTDTNDDYDGFKSQFVSKYARSLERSRSIGRSGGGDSGHYKRYTGTGYEYVRAKGTRNNITLAQFVRGLNHRYNLITWMMFLGILFLSIFVYSFFFSS